MRSEVKFEAKNASKAMRHGYAKKIFFSAHRRRRSLAPPGAELRERVIHFVSMELKLG